MANRSSFKKISNGEMKGWVQEDLWGLLPSRFFLDPLSSIQEMGGEVIKESRRRVAAILPLPTEQGIFFKKDTVLGWRESLKYLFYPSKGRKEWLIADRLKQRDLNIPRPLGWMEKTHRGFLKESYYFSEAIGNGTSFIEDSVKKRDDSCLDELAVTLRRVHDAGLFHQDLHGGNFLRCGASFFLADLHRAQVLRSVSLDRRLWNLAQLFHSLRSSWGEEERLRFLEKYFLDESPSFERRKELLRRVESSMDRLQQRQWQSRTKRCLRESTEFSIKKEGGNYYYHRRDFPLDDIRRIILTHRCHVEEKPFGLAKNSSEVKVSVLENGENRVCVKQFCYPRFWDWFKEHFRQSKGLKSWVAGNGLRVKGISCVKLFALMERKNWFGLVESFLVMEASEKSLEMDRYILGGVGDIGRKRRFIKDFAQWLLRLHRKDLYHQDMKTCNILVSENGETWNFCLLDLEDVQLDEKVDEKGLFRNLLQLNTSLPKTISRTDRLRFFKEYVRDQKTIRNERNFIYRLWEKSRKRGVVYVSPQGVVEEKWS